MTSLVRFAIELEVQKMLQKGAIRHALFHPKQFISNLQLFVIPKKTGDLRPVINLKPLNDFVQYHHFKMEGLNSLLDLLSGSEFFTTIDLKDAYFTIPIHPEHYKYLRFEWNSTLYEFMCLPFGLSSSPRVFTKVMKPFVSAVRNKGIRLVIYLDDQSYYQFISRIIFRRNCLCHPDVRILRFYCQQGKGYACSFAIS